MARYHVIGEPTTAEDAAALAASGNYQFQYSALGLVAARPTTQNQKKGADKGADGRFHFHNGSDKTRQIIFSVKGRNLKTTDLRGVIDRERVDIGLLLSFEKPTKLMRTEAASAAFLPELLEGASVDYLKTAGINRTYKPAPRQLKKVAEQRDVFGAGESDSV